MRLTLLIFILCSVIAIKASAFPQGWQDNTGWAKSENTVSLQITTDTVGVGTVHMSGELQLIGIGTTQNGAILCTKPDGRVGSCQGAISGYRCATCL